MKTKVNSQQPSLWDDIAKQYTDTPDEGETEIATELESILKHYDVLSGSSLLESGCGSGHISSFLAAKGYQTTLLDFSEIALQKAKELYEKNNLKGNFIHSDLFEISPQTVGTHDVVWNSGVLEHFDGWQIIDAMQKMAATAKKFVIILVPNSISSSYLDFRKKALESGGWQWGLEILRDNLKDLALFSGLEVVEERFVGKTHLKYFEKFVESITAETDNTSEKIPDNQKYLKVIIAKPIQNELDLETKIDLLLKILKNDSAVLRQTYYNDVTILMEKLKSLGITINENDLLITQLKNDLSFEKRTITYLKTDLKAEKELTFRLQESLDYEKQRVDELLNTKTWKLTKLYERKFQGNFIGKIIEKLVDFVLKGQDNQEPIQTQDQSLLQNDLEKKQKLLSKTFDEIESILTENKDVKGIIIYPPAIDWNIPLLQRPQHMATNLAQNNWLYFYCTTNAYDKVNGFKKLSDNLYLTNKYDELIEKLDSFVMFIHSAHPTLTITEIKNLEKKSILLYDYLDEIHPAVSGLKPNDVLDRHTYLMKNSKAVLATAKKLFSDVKKLREDNVFLLPNAVDYEHFHKTPDLKTIPKEIKSIKDSGGPILGYFGALAKWFDYELIKKIAQNQPEWNIVLIGWDYDDSLKQSGIKEFKNIHYLGIKEYSVLPNYAIWFDVCLLPFLLNDITHSTSPIKLFEYMALGKPIVSTPIKEVSNYKSPLIAKSTNEFIEKIKQSLELKNDSNYIELIDKEAKENTWKKRFDDLNNILENLTKTSS